MMLLLLRRRLLLSQGQVRRRRLSDNGIRNRPPPPSRLSDSHPPRDVPTPGSKVEFIGESDGTRVESKSGFATSLLPSFPSFISRHVGGRMSAS